jgi:MFS family permease
MPPAFFWGPLNPVFFGIIVYLTHWFCARDRSRAIACLYAANPAAALIGSPLAGWLLGVHWQSLAGWRWLFIMEGIPAVVVGAITYFYMTNRPVQARWLPREERDWLVKKPEEELQAKNKIRNLSILEAFGDARILRLMLRSPSGSANYIPVIAALRFDRKPLVFPESIQALQSVRLRECRRPCGMACLNYRFATT